MEAKYSCIFLYAVILLFGAGECQILEIADFVTSPNGGSITVGQPINIQWRWTMFPVCSPNIVEIQFCPGTQIEGCFRLGSGAFGESSFQWITTSLASSGRIRLQLNSANGLPTRCRRAVAYSPMFTFCSPLVIENQPESAFVVAGTDVQFWIGASGTQISLQWLLDNQPIAKANQAIYTISSAQPIHSGLYSVRVEDGCQTSITSDTATLRVCPPIVVQQFNPGLAEVGQPFTLSINATGLALQFSWFKAGTLLAQADSFYFGNFEARDYGQYSIKIEDACGQSTELSIMLSTKPFAIVKNPPSESFLFVGDSIRLDIQVLKGDFEVFYQWYRNGDPIPGETSSGIDVTDFGLADNGTQYIVSVNTDGLTLRSDPSVILAHPIPEIVSTSVVPGPVFPGQDVVFSVAALGQRLQYEWIIDGTKYENLTGFSVVQIRAGQFSESLTQVVARVSNPNGFVESSPMPIEFKPKPSFGNDDMLEYYMLLNQTLLLDMEVVGEELSFRWFRFNDTVGLDESTLEVQLDPNLVSTMYQLEARNPSGVTLGPEIWIRPEPAPTIVSYSESPFFYFPDTQPILYVNATGQGVQYRWFRGADLMLQESSRLRMWPLSDLNNGLVMRCEAYNINGFVSSVSIILSMEPAPVITKQIPTPQSIFANETAELSIHATGRALTFFWKLSIDIPFNTSEKDGVATIQAPNVRDAFSAYVEVHNPSGFARSNVALVLIHSPPQFIIKFEDIKPTAVNTRQYFRAVVTGVAVTYTWMLNGSVVLYNSLETFWFTPVLTPAFNNTIVKLIASNPSGSVSTETRLVVVTLPKLRQPLQPLYDVLVGSQIVINVASEGYGILYEWRQNGNWIQNTTVGLFERDKASTIHSGDYQLYMHNIAGTAGPFPFRIQVVLISVSSPNAGGVRAFPGDTVSLSVEIHTDEDVILAWYLGARGIPGASSNSYTIANVSTEHEGEYKVLVSLRQGGNPSEHRVTTLTILGKPELIHFSQPVADVNAGKNITFSILATPEERLTYKWYRNGEEILGETGRTLTFEASMDMDGHTIQAQLTNPVDSIWTDEVELSVRLSPKAIILIALFIGGAFIVGVILAVIFVRRKMNQRRQISFNKATYGIEDIKYTLLPPWTAPADSKLCRKLENLPVTFSKHALTFGGEQRFNVNEEYTDTIEVKWQGGLISTLSTLQQTKKRISKRATDLEIPLLDASKKERNFTVKFHLPETPKCTLTATPQDVTLDYRWRINRPSTVDSSSDNDAVQFKLKMNVATNVTALIGVEMPDIGRHFYIPCDIVTNPSVWIDIDDIALDSAPIGEGGFGVVYRGNYNGNIVAVKMLKFQEWVDPKTMEEFEREIQFLSELKNPGIVSLIGASKLPGKLAIVTEFIPNGSLEKLMTKKIPYATKLKIVLEIAEAINFLHKNNVLHRDIKADNVLIASTDVNAQNMIRLSDFGSARRFAEDKMETYTRNVGTPIYMAPEILQKKRYSKEADIYSFGILLWVIITQKEPYTAFNHVWDVTKFVIDGNREVIPAGCPADYAELITGCWDPDPQKRLTLDVIIARLNVMYDRQFNCNM